MLTSQQGGPGIVFGSAWLSNKRAWIRMEIHLSDWIPNCRFCRGYNDTKWSQSVGFNRFLSQADKPHSHCVFWPDRDILGTISVVPVIETWRSKKKTLRPSKITCAERKWALAFHPRPNSWVVLGWELEGLSNTSSTSRAFSSMSSFWEYIPLLMIQLFAVLIMEWCGNQPEDVGIC